jgi:lipopolysaccharide exporter
MPTTLKRQSVEGVKSAAASHIAITLLSLVQLSVLARSLTPADFGLMGMINVVLGLASLFGDVGITSFIIHRQQDSRDILSTLFWVNLLLAFALCCVVWGAAPLIVQFYGEPRLRALLLSGAPILVLMACGQTYLALLEKDLCFALLARLEIASTIVGALSAIILARTGFGVFSLLGGAYATLITKTLALAWKGCERWRPSITFDWRTVRDALGFGVRLLGQRAANYVTANVDFLLIGSFLGAQQLGYYTLAYNVANLPSTKVNAVLARVLFPAFSKIQGDSPRIKRGYLRLQELAAMLNFPLLFGLIVVARHAIAVLFGPSWEPVVPLLQILCLVGMGRAIAGTVGPLLLARGRTDLGFKWSLLLLAIQIPGILVGLLAGGTTGVAIAFASLQTLYAVLNYPILVRSLIGPCLREYLSTMWPPFWMSLVMAAFTLTVRSSLQHLPKAALLALCITSGGLMYLGLVWHLRRSEFSDLTQLMLSREGGSSL